MKVNDSWMKGVAGLMFALCVGFALACNGGGGGGSGGGGGGGGSGNDWTIPTGPGTNYRATHMGGNWGPTFDAASALPAEYFEYLRDLNVNWVGISVALHLEDSMDSTVAREYSGVALPTFSDTVLVNMIKRFRQHGFHVYLTLAFEFSDDMDGVEHPVERAHLGDPNVTVGHPDDYVPAFWPWRTDHPNHAAFVAEFWETYTDQAVHYGQIAQAQGVELYSLGAETDRLFRSGHPAPEDPEGDYWTNDFCDELQSMVLAVRAVYSGLLTYNMEWTAVASDFFDSGSDDLWDDLDLDVIGLSAYFHLVDSPPSTIMSVADLEIEWEEAFQDYLVPLRTRNPLLPIIFLEYGYMDFVSAPCPGHDEEGPPRDFVDEDENSLDDGMETQANIYQAFFNVIDKNPGAVNLEGAFLWNQMMADNQTWAAWIADRRGFSVRGKLAADVVRTTYADWRD